jgi:uncharacterized membrane protein
MNDQPLTLASAADFLSSRQAEIGVWFLAIFGNWSLHDWLANIALVAAIAMSISNVYLNYFKAKRLKRGKSAETVPGSL